MLHPTMHQVSIYTSNRKMSARTHTKMQWNLKLILPTYFFRNFRRCGYFEMNPYLLHFTKDGKGLVLSLTDKWRQWCPTTKCSHTVCNLLGAKIEIFWKHTAKESYLSQPRKVSKSLIWHDYSPKINVRVDIGDEAKRSKLWSYWFMRKLIKLKWQKSE